LSVFSFFFPEEQVSAIQVGTPSLGRISLLRTTQKARKPPIINSSFIVPPPEKILSDIQKNIYSFVCWERRAVVKNRLTGCPAIF
jgi:hypothetical protein